MAKKSFKALYAERQADDAFWTEKAILDFTVDLHRQMSAKGVTKADLARKLSVSPAYVTKVLQGNVNFTIQTMVRLARAVGAQYCIRLVDHGRHVWWLESIEGGIVQPEIKEHAGKSVICTSAERLNGDTPPVAA